GSNGIVEAFGCGYGDFAQILNIQQDGKIVVGGSTDCVPYPQFGYGIIRLSTDGSFDPSFNGNGKVLMGFDGNGYANVSDVAVQSDGKIVLLSTLTLGYPDYESKFALTRHNADGSLDPGFGSGGIVLAQVSQYSRSGGVQVQPDGKIVVSG